MNRRGQLWIPPKAAQTDITLRTGGKVTVDTARPTREIEDYSHYTKAGKPRSLQTGIAGYKSSFNINIAPMTRGMVQYLQQITFTWPSCLHLPQGSALPEPGRLVGVRPSYTNQLDCVSAAPVYRDVVVWVGGVGIFEMRRESAADRLVGGIPNEQDITAPRSGSSTRPWPTRRTCHARCRRKNSASGKFHACLTPIFVPESQISMPEMP